MAANRKSREAPKPSTSGSAKPTMPPIQHPAMATAATGITSGLDAVVRTRKVFSIRWVVAFTVVALVASAVLTAGVFSERNTRQALEREVEERLLSQARSLALTAGDALLSEFPELTLHPLTLEMKNRQPELARIVVMDRDRRIVGDPDPRQLGSILRPEREPRGVAARQSLRDGEQMLGDGTTLVASVPVTHRDGRSIGTALVGLQLRYLDDVIDKARRQQTLVLAIVLVVGVTGATAVISFLLRPVAVLRAGIDRIGRGDLETPIRLRDHTELGVLADAVNHMAARLRLAQSELVERERLAHELELARQIQSSLLPARRLVAGPFVIEGSNRAAQEVGGDYFDYFELPDGRIGIAIADVSGKGLAGCMVMSMLSALLRAYREVHTSPSSLLAILDERLGERLQRGSFVTMFYGVLDVNTGDLTYANAGHSPLLVCRHGEERVTSCAASGIPLGAMRGGRIRKTLVDETLRLEPGDLLVQFTDGLNEAFEPTHREQFGFERLEQAVSASASRGAAAVLAAVHGALQVWVGDAPPHDDETLLVVARQAQDPARTSQSSARSAGESADTALASASPLAVLAHAAAVGIHIGVQCAIENLVALRPWLEDCGAQRELEQAEFEIMHVAIHEACANIVEHGCGNDANATFDLWYFAAPTIDSDQHSACFVIRDDGVPFTDGDWQATDFSDRRTWRRGRGFGLDIIHRGMHRVDYHPGTSRGNITVMTFLAADLRKKLEERHHA